MAVESHGLPIGIVLDGANRHDVKLLEDTLKSIVTAHPEGMNQSLDAGYVVSQKVVEGMGYEAHIRSRGEEKSEQEKNREFKARWWRYAIRG
jgi:putative transposase